MNSIVEDFNFDELDIKTPVEVFAKKIIDKKMQNNLIRWCVQHVFPCNENHQILFEWEFDDDNNPIRINVSTKAGDDDYYIIGDDVTSIPVPLYFEPDWHKNTMERFYANDGLCYDAYIPAKKVTLNLEGTRLQNLDGIENKDFIELTISSKMKSLESLKDLRIETLIIQDSEYIYDLSEVPKLEYRLYLMHNRNLKTLKGLRSDIPFVMITNRQPIYKTITNEDEFLNNYTIYNKQKRRDEEVFEIKQMQKKGHTLIFSAVHKTNEQLTESVDFNEVHDDVDHDEMLHNVYEDTVRMEFEKFNDAFFEFLHDEYEYNIYKMHNPKIMNGLYNYYNGPYSTSKPFLCIELDDNFEIIVWFQKLPYVKKWKCGFERYYAPASDLYQRYPLDLMKILATIKKIHKNSCSVLKLNLLDITESRGLIVNIKKQNKKLLDLFKKYTIEPLDESSWYGEIIGLLPWLYYKLGSKNIPDEFKGLESKYVNESINFDEVNDQDNEFVDSLEQSVNPEKLYIDFTEKFQEFLNVNNTLNDHSAFMTRINWLGRNEIYYDTAPGKRRDICELSYNEKDMALYIIFKHVPEIKRWCVSRDHGWQSMGGTKEYIDFIKVLKDLNEIKQNIINGPLLTFASIAVCGNDNKMFVNIANQSDYEALDKFCLNYAIGRIKLKNILINKNLVSSNFNLRKLYKILKIDNNPFEKYIKEGIDFNSVQDDRDLRAILFEKPYKETLFAKIFEVIKNLFKEYMIGGLVYYAYSIKNNAMCITDNKAYHKLELDADKDLPDSTYKRDTSLKETSKTCYTICFKDLSADVLEIDKFLIPGYLLGNADNLYERLHVGFLLSRLYKIHSVVLNFTMAQWDDGRELAEQRLMFTGNFDYVSTDYLNRPIDSNMFDNIGLITSTKNVRLDVYSLMFSGKNPDDALASFDKFVEVFDKGCIKLDPVGNFGLRCFGKDDSSAETIKMLIKRMKRGQSSNKYVNEDFNFNNVRTDDLAIEVFSEKAMVSMYDMIFEKIKKCFKMDMYYFYSIKENAMYISRHRWMHKLNKDLADSGEHPYDTANLKRFSSKNIYLLKPGVYSSNEDSLYAINAILEFNDFMHEDIIRIKKCCMIMYVTDPVMWGPLCTALEISGAYKIEELYMCYFTVGQKYIKMWSSGLFARLKPEIPVMNNNIGIIKANREYNFDIDHLTFSGKSYDEALNKFRLFIEMFDKQFFDIRLRGDKEIILNVQGKEIELPTQQAEQIIAEYYNIDKTP